MSPTRRWAPRPPEPEPPGLHPTIYTRRLSPEERDAVDAGSAGDDSPSASDADETNGDGRDAGSTRPRRRHGHSLWSTLAPLSLIAGLVCWVGFGFVRYDEIRLGIVGVIMVCVIGAPVLHRLGAGRSFDLSGLLVTALGAKLASIAVRYDTIFSAYDGFGDAVIYHREGSRLAAAYRAFDFAEPAKQKIPGTGFIRVVTGYVYALLHDNIGIGFLVFGMFAFVGSYLLYRGFEIAVPDGRHHRYAALLLLWPSMLFWPSAIGKEAWLMLGIGLTAYGGARVLTHARAGLPFLVGGLWAVTMTRPHVTVMLFGGFAIAYALRAGGRIAGLGVVSKLIGMGVLVLASGVLLSQFEEFFGLDEFSADSITETLESTEDRTSQGGSKYSSPNPLSPVGYPVALVTVLVRPFPFEADNLQMLITSLEGVVLGFLLLRSARPILRAPARFRQRPYVAMAMAYIAVFAFGFSSVGNFGILARQRVQLIPFALVLVCLSRHSGQADQATDGSGEATTGTGRGGRGRRAGTTRTAGRSHPEARSDPDVAIDEIRPGVSSRPHSP